MVSAPTISPAEPLALIQEEAKIAQPRSKWQKLISKVWEIARYALMGGIGAAFFFVNPTLFSIGFLAGIVWDEKAQEVIDKIIQIWKKVPWAGIAAIGIAAFFSLEVTFAAATTVYAAYLGSKLVQISRGDQP